MGGARSAPAPDDQGREFQVFRGDHATTSKQLSEALLDLHRELIAGLVDSGDSIPELTKRVMGVFENADKYRAERIARTEASTAVHTASLTSAKESGVVAGKDILLSSNACPLCVDTKAAHPGGVGLDSNFATIGTNPDYADKTVTPIHPDCLLPGTIVLAPLSIRGLKPSTMAPSCGFDCRTEAM